MTALAAAEFSQIPMSQALAATLARASDAAGATGAEEIGLEHLLNALCDDPDALGVLDSSHVDIFRLKAETADYVMRLARGAPPSGARDLSVAPALRRILEAAAAAARGGRRRDINGAIVLAAIIGDGKSVAAQMLQAQGLTFEAAIKALQSALAQPARDEAPPPAEDVLARARERVQSRSAPSLRDIMHDGPRPVAPPPPPEMPRHEPPPAMDPPAAPFPAPRQQQATREAAPEERQAPPVSMPRANDGGGLEVAREQTHAGLPAAVAGTSAPPQWEPIPAAPPAPLPHAPPVMAPSAPPAAPAPAYQESEAPRPPQAPPKPFPSQSAPAAEPAPYAFPAPAPVPPSPAPPVATQPAPARPNAAPSRDGGYVYPSAQPMPRAPSPSPVTPAAPAPRSMTLDATAGGPAMPPPIPPPIPRAPPAGGAPALSKMAAPSISVHGPGAAPGMGAGPSLGAPARSAGPGSMPAPGLAPQSPSPQMRREPAGKAEIGQLAENIPRSMRVGLSERVEVRIARAHVKALTEGLEGGGLAWKHEVTVAQVMSVRLRAPQGGFFIETASPETQWVENQVMAAGDDYASWRFLVTPQRRGWASLQIIVSARTVGADGLAAETAMPDQVIEVKVKTNLKRLLLRWSGWAAAAVVGGLLSKFGEGFFEAGKQIVQKFIT
jgi:hypothetical protein